MTAIGSLFSGIGGFERGLEMSGLGPVRWQIENDEFCSQVLAKHWPDTVRFRDIGTVHVDQLEPVDVVCGGFPCQPASVAGRRGGQSDTRWLWPEFARVLRGVRPRFVAIENVPGLLTVDRGAAFGTVLGDLASLGYDAWWDVLAAAETGAPHKRDRLFVIAWLAHDAGVRSREQAWQILARRDLSEWSRRNVANAHGSRQHEPKGSVSEQRGWSPNGGERPAEPGVDRNPDGLSGGIHPGWPAGRGQAQYPYEPARTEAKVPRRRERLKVLGNAVVPQCAEAIGHVIRSLAEATP